MCMCKVCVTWSDGADVQSGPFCAWISHNNEMHGTVVPGPRFVLATHTLSHLHVLTLNR